MAYALGVTLSRGRSACLISDSGAPIAITEAWLIGQPDDLAPPAFGRRYVQMPECSIDYCLSNAGISFVDLDAIVFCDPALSVAGTTREGSVADCVLRLPFSPQSRMLMIDPMLAHAHGVHHLSGFHEAAIVVTARDHNMALRGGYTAYGPVTSLGHVELFKASEGSIFRVARASCGAPETLRKQQSIEDMLLGLSAQALLKTGCDRLCVAGDVVPDTASGIRTRNALNAREVFVQPVTNDGTALGAALYGWRHEQLPSLRD
ncbi:MAG TPA: hypothetical protein VL598_01770 [Trinickia sp.]|jgi:predicted NodU family carbamoyl transferase|uniref:hypothetical protein n=1 Tax=Trinickia sp. TaxID=2571163 RepID=UPI002C42CF49|nr:hypothetical protein [Trinickia sp.]HTI16372.1 hypothetical protein [Trinickia sp.]